MRVLVEGRQRERRLVEGKQREEEEEEEGPRPIRAVTAAETEGFQGKAR
jgi:hypothetical protein